VCIFLGCKWSDKYGVAVAVECYHDVLVAAACAWLKSASIVGEETVDREFMDFDTVGCVFVGWQWYWCSCSYCRLLLLCGAYVLAWLGHVAPHCFICVGAIPRG